MFDPPSDIPANVDPQEAAQSDGLRHVSDGGPGIRRKRTALGARQAQGAHRRSRAG